MSFFILIFVKSNLKLYIMNEFILRENVLTDNILMIPDKGRIFKGGYVGIIKEYQFQNAWSDKEIIKRFRSKERLTEYLDKNYPQVQYEYDFSGTCLE